MENAIPIIETEDVKLSVTQPMDGVVLIHCHVYDWSPGKYREFISYWADILTEFKNHGYEKLYCIIPEHEHKICKFAEMFGFERSQRFGYEKENTGETGMLVKYEFPLEVI